jgi:cyclophilin family peptidyl-prolyl cis-trans isomerase
MTRHSAIESLEARIAPAITVFHPIPDIVAGVGKTGATVDLEAIVDEDGSHRTRVEFTLNMTLPGQTSPAKITLDLFDDKAPLSVQNFLSYVNGPDGANYLGTFFHRVFDFGTGSGAGMDIIQAGGFDVTNLTQHIPTGLTLHNEYNPDDLELQNSRGTISMAKTALSPHTATSEWFINLTDNSTILGGANNGGFTVFGKVTDESLATIDAIGQAMKINRQGALTDLPVQGYPEGGTSAPEPKHLFQITEAKVVAIPSDAAGYTFSAVATEVGSTTESTLLTTSVNGGQLTLNYLTGKTGQADVTVTIKKTGEADVTDTFRVKVQPNLITNLASHSLPDQFFIADKGTSKITLSNNGGGLAKGSVKLQLFLSEIINNGNDPKTFTVDEDDIPLEEKVVSINIASGKSATLPLKFDVEYGVGEKVLVNGKAYLVVAKVDTAGAGFTELFTDDNDDAFRQTNTGYVFNLAVGKAGNRVDRSLTLEGVTYTLSGNGTAVLVPLEGGSFSINVTGTDANSNFTVKTGRGVEQHIQDINISTTIGRLNLGTVNLHGDFTALGGAKSITLGDLMGGPIDRTLSINAFPGGTQKLALSFGDVTDYSLTTNMPVSKLSAKSWLDTEATTGANDIFVAGLGSLKIAGGLEASVFNASTAKIAQIQIGGTLNGATIKTLGDIGSVKLRNMVSSSVLAGVAQQPNDLGDFADGRTISSFTVTENLSDSVVAAAKFNSIVLGSVNTTAGTTVKGIYADAIKSYLRKGEGGVRLSRLDDTTPAPEVPTLYNSSGNYEVALF